MHSVYVVTHYEEPLNPEIYGVFNFRDSAEKFCKEYFSTDDSDYYDFEEVELLD